MSQRVAGGKGSQRKRGADGLFEASGVAQCADEAMVRLDVGGIGDDGGAEGFGCLRRLAFREHVEAALRKRIGSVGLGHGCL